MRMRSTAAAVLVAAGLAVSTTGAAAAGEPDDDRPDRVTVTCENGEPVVRVPTEEERKRLRVVPAEPARPLPERAERAERAGVGPDGRAETRVLPDGGVIRVVPAEPGEAPPPCDGPHAVERGERAVPAPRR
jgi:hypothetical protein